MHPEQKQNIPYLQAKTSKFVWFFVIFYAVGLVGMLIPTSTELFLQLIPFALIISFLGLFLFHSFRKDRTDSFVFLSIYIFAFAIEALGVSTKIIFGSYEYGSSLGVKFLNTPLIIGINWLFLVYTTATLFERSKLHPAIKIILASMLMVVYDLVLENVAPQMKMWYWEDEFVPLQNYLAWFMLAILFHSLIKVFRLNTSNRLAVTLLCCQFIFFLTLSIFL